MKKTLTLALLGITLASPFTGFATATETTFDDTSKTNMAVPATSTIDDKIIFNLSEVGNFDNNNDTFHGSVQIGDGTTTTNGLLLHQGYGTHYHTFEGALTGNGTISRTGSSTPNITLNFLGDTSAFTGNVTLDTSSGGYTVVQFGDGTNTSGLGTSNGDFTAGGKTITMNRNNSSEKVIFNYGSTTAGETATIAHAIAGNHSRIELQGNAHMKFTGNTIIHTLTVGENVSDITFNSTGSLWTVNGTNVHINKAGTGNFFLENKDIALSSATVTGGALITKGDSDYANLGNITVGGNRNAEFRTNSSGDEITLHNTITTQATNGSTIATFKARQEGAAWKMGNFRLWNDYIDGISGALTVTDASLTVADGKTFYLKSSNFTNSLLTIGADSKVEAFNYSNRIALDDVTIEAGGKLHGTTDSNGHEIFSFKGDVVLTLSNLGGTNGAFTTNVLPGRLGADSTLTLNFTDELLGSTLNGLDAFTITFTGLSADTGVSLTGANFTNMAGQWYVSIDDPAASDLTLSFSTTAIPEPATATLSLLALAGLCVRRRRK